MERNRVRKITLEDFRIMVKECSFCGETMDFDKIEIYLLSVPGISQLVCRTCLRKLFWQMKEALVEE